MKTALSNFYYHLEKGGILIFDVVDKSIGINSKKEEYEYEDENLKILFKLQWIFNKEKNVLEDEILFVYYQNEISKNIKLIPETKEFLKKIKFYKTIKISKLLELI